MSTLRCECICPVSYFFAAVFLIQRLFREAFLTGFSHLP
jgi:hypothetical protein